MTAMTIRAKRLNPGTFQPKRLLKLAAFLDKLPPKKFNYKIFAHATPCDTVACAMGWMPAVWPSLFKWLPWADDLLQIAPRACASLEVGEHCITRFFGITVSEKRFLFYPSDHVYAGASPLPGTASPKEVAAHIRQFVSRKLVNPTQEIAQ